MAEAVAIRHSAVLGVIQLRPDFADDERRRRRTQLRFHDQQHAIDDAELIGDYVSGRLAGLRAIARRFNSDARDVSGRLLTPRRGMARYDAASTSRHTGSLFSAICRDADMTPCAGRSRHAYLLSSPGARGH